MGWQWLSFPGGAFVWCWTLMCLPQKWLQLSPLFVCVFMTPNPSSCSCVLVVLIFFFPFLPLALLLCSNSVFHWPKYEARQTEEDFFPVLRVRISYGAYGIVNLKAFTLNVITPPLQHYCEGIALVPPLWLVSLYFPCQGESGSLWKCDRL